MFVGIIKDIDLVMLEVNCELIKVLIDVLLEFL